MYKIYSDGSAGNALLIVGIVVVVLIIIIVGWFISTSNKFKRMNVKIDEALSGIDVALTKRYDLLTKAVATAKGYAKHEQETLEKIISMRNPGKYSSVGEKQQFADATTEAIKSLNVVVEQYPNLKADSHFLTIQNQIAEVEEQLQAARRLYNSNVSSYNQSIIVFPASIVANMMKLQKREFFEAESHKRDDVKIEF